MNSKTALITGANGFFGTHLVRLLRTRFPKLAVYEVIMGAGRAEANSNSFNIDLLDRDAIAGIVYDVKPDYIFHLAGVIYSRVWQELYKGNVEITVNVLDAVLKQNTACRIIMPGSAAEYGRIIPADLPLTERQALNPASPYGVAKAWQSTLARYYAVQGADVVIGRVFNVIGKGVSENLSIGAFISQLNKIKNHTLPPDIRVGNLRPKRDFIDIHDAVEGLIALALKGSRGEIYNICSGTSVSMEDILTMMIKKSGVQATITVDPERIKAADIEDIYGSYQKIHLETGWRPVLSLEDSVMRLFS